MSSNVVFGICEALAQQSIAALRFNFRGVGKSGGKYGDGIDEQEDLKAALVLISATPNIDHQRIGLAGYSFGTSVAVPVAIKTQKASLLALVSPALSDSGWEQLKTYSRPTFIIGAEHDFLISPDQLRQYVRDMPQVDQCEIISGTDHFWNGYEAEVASRVAGFFSAGFSQV